ncbi:(R,S)-reticuline 7-O-methyltransferase-like [Diospyros lotus]|uniref:(R,S)-reticuline 7-O-methyltransferase-like n=1 Tax=Diospyros lotus TaxID=55363 RepID=UPI00225072C8|nr:(R,S)-reticuline 7-O-methyltransferase-like [Diospyros lotus]XP_052208169.1 (R,S)-reticuline 7-O-methyltransferase-like [Diospyros lotus]
MIMEKEAIDSEAMVLLDAQAEIWQQMLSFADAMALKSAVELRIADIIHSSGCPISLSQIVAGIDAPSPDIVSLERIMRFLVRKMIFTANPPSDDGGETLYGLTHASKFLLHDAELSMAPFVLFLNDPRSLAPWRCLSRCVREGGIAFEKAHGKEIWDYNSANPDFSKLYNAAMGCTAKVTTTAIVAAYKDGFHSIGSLVDVGGGIGTSISEITKAYPHIKAINFDLQNVVATAPEYPGVTHIGGDMFESVPKADAVFMKWILHDWSDEDCVKILKNCRKAILEKTGKVILMEVILKPGGENVFGNTGFVLDLLMLAHSSGGKERTEAEWKLVLEKGGFPRYNIIRIPAFPSIIEAYPN